MGLENNFIEFFQMFLNTRENKEILQNVVALIGAAISYLVLRSRNVDVFGVGLNVGHILWLLTPKTASQLSKTGEDLMPAERVSP
jgi:hypothetical protein